MAEAAEKIEGEGEAGEDVTAALEELRREKEALSAKVSELLGETKKAKAARAEAERKAEEEARRKAEAEGNFKQLFESSENERKTLAEKLSQMESQTASEKVNGEAIKLASTMAEGVNVELLADFIARRLKYNDGAVKVLDDKGNLTVSTLDDLRKEFMGSARYSALIKGNQSSGGGATGGSSSGGAAKTMTREQFDKLDPVARMKFIKGGGKTTST